MGDRAKSNPTERREILREHRAARDPRRNSPTVSLPRRQQCQRATATASRGELGAAAARGVTVTAAALGGVPTADITVDGIEPRHAVLYFHRGVYVISDAFIEAGLASQVGRRTQAKVISVDYRLAPEHPYPQRLMMLFPPMKPSWATASALQTSPSREPLAGGGLAICHPGQRLRSRAGSASRGVRDVPVC